MGVLARATSERGEVVLREYDEPGHPPVLELRVNGVFVMDTHETSTEVALATRSLAAAPNPRRVLVGGLGLGFTAQAVLHDQRVEQVDVVEIEPALVDWMRDGTVPHGPSLLANERLNVIVDDVRRAVATVGGPAYDLALLDVDNGPGYLVYDENAAVYAAHFLADVASILNLGGVLAVWSADRTADLLAILKAVFGACEEVALPVNLQGRNESYWLYLASSRG
ncbi:MAG: hypothetical protein KDB38_04430 [Nocardioidaceae bacterium]|nr:hypothetical protein [Nocardioidaceae bacterium]MCO5324841.1 hypothetical protein [Nocardioidaceae bacterium]